MVSPVVGDRKLSSAVLVLENCLLPISQHASIASPGSFPLEGPTPKLQPAPTVQQRASSVKDDVGDGSFTNLASFGVTDKAEVELEPSLYRVPKPKRAAAVKRKNQKLKTVLQIVPGQLDIGARSSEAEQNMCSTAESGVGIETSVMHRMNLKLEEAESLRVDDKRLFEAENFVGVRKRKAGAKKEKRAGKRQKSGHGAGTVDVVEPVVEDEENGTTWMVSPSGGDEERVILKRRKKVAFSQDVMFTDVTGTGLLNADVTVTPECPGYAPSGFENSFEQFVAQDKIIEGKQTVAAVETEVEISRPDALGTEVVVKRKWARKMGKRTAKKNISLGISETDTVETAGSPAKKRTRFKRKGLKSEENLEPSRAVVPASVTTRVTRSRSNGNNGGAAAPHQMDSSQNVTVNMSEETAKTTLPNICEESIALQMMAIEEGSAGNKEIVDIENTEKELLCDADLLLTGVETGDADVQFVKSQEAMPKTYAEPTHITSALDLLNTDVVDNGISVTEIGVDGPTVGDYTVSSNREMTEKRDSTTQRSSDERVTTVPDRDDHNLEKPNTSLPETIALQVSIESEFKDQRGELSSIELFHDNENIVPTVALDDGNDPLASGDIAFIETPSPEKPLPCDDLSNSTGGRIKKPLNCNTDVNLCKSLNSEDLPLISSSANSTALAESGSLAVQDCSNEFSARNRTNSVSDSCLDVASRPIEAVLSSAVGPVILSLGSDDLLIATERISSVQQTSNVPKVDGRNESGGRLEICSEGTYDQNSQHDLSASDVLDTSKTKSDTSETAEDLAGHSTCDGLESDAKTVTKDTPCNSDSKRSSEGGVMEEPGFVPLKKRRLRMAESVSEFVAVDVKGGVTLDAVNQSSELSAQNAACIGGLTTGAKEPSSTCALPAAALHDADAVARQRKYVGAHVSSAGIFKFLCAILLDMILF